MVESHNNPISTADNIELSFQNLPKFQAPRPCCVFKPLQTQTGIFFSRLFNKCLIKQLNEFGFRMIS